MTEDAKHDAQRLQKEKTDEAEWLTQHVTQDPELQQEWIRQDNLGYGGLLAIGIALVQPFVAGETLDTSGMICAVAFAIAIPLLAALVLVNRQETFRRRRTSSRTVAVARAVAQASATVGLVAGFWHLHWIAGVGVLVSAVVAVGIHSAGFTRLELSERPTSQAAKAAESPRSPVTPTRSSAPPQPGTRWPGYKRSDDAAAAFRLLGQPDPDSDSLKGLGVATAGTGRGWMGRTVP